MPLDLDLQSHCASQHFGPWEVEPGWYRQALAAVNDGAWQPKNPDRPLEIIRHGGNAIIPIHGMMTPGRSSFGGTSMIEAAGLIRTADRDREVTRIVLAIDTPGGTFMGSEMLVKAVARCSTPTLAIVNTMCCSGGLKVASQCRRIIAHGNAVIGSIGAYAVLRDSTEAAKKAGLKEHLVTSGELKGAGADGAVTDALLAEAHKRILEIHDIFVDVLSAGRGMARDEVEKLADGTTWFAPKAKELGLIDRVVEADDITVILDQEDNMTRDEFREAAKQHSDWLAEEAQPLIDNARTEGSSAAKPQPATLEQLEQAYPNDPKFVLEQYKAKASLDAAKLAAAETKSQELEETKGKVTELENRLAELDPAEAGQSTPVQGALPKSTNQKKADPVEETFGIAAD